MIKILVRKIIEKNTKKLWVCLVIFSETFLEKLFLFFNLKTIFKKQVSKIMVKRVYVFFLFFKN